MKEIEDVILFLCVMQSIVVGVVLFQCHELIGETRALRKLIKKDFQEHQEWLFNQLYSMAPGKVLKPDEVAEESEDRPAEIYIPSEDAMAEFNGDKNDWHV